MATKSDAVALPGARAVARHVRVSPMKARRVVDLVRGLPAKEALTVLKFAPQAASEQVYKVLASAVANAENNERLDPDALLVSEAFVDEGPTLKRFRPRAQGRAYRIRKRTCHITIELAQGAPVSSAPAVPAMAAPEPEPVEEPEAVDELETVDEAAVEETAEPEAEETEEPEAEAETEEPAAQAETPEESDE